MTKAVIISGHSFLAPLRFSEGHVLTANEAAALNAQLHREVGSKIKSQIEKHEKEHGALTAEHVAKLQQVFHETALAHTFVSKSNNSFDPVQREAFKILRPMVLKLLDKKNIDPKTLPEGRMEELMLQALTKRPDVEAEAKRRASAIKELAADTIGVE